MDACDVNAYTPMETTEICSRVGSEKANMRVDKVCISAVVAGCYIALASSVCLVVNTSPGYTTLAALHRRISISQMLMHWAVTFFGNLAGSLFIVGIVIGYGGVLDDKLYREEAIKFADGKAYTPMWHQIFMRYWRQLARVPRCWLAFQARDVAGKIAAIWWPVFAFVALGLDHVVANMCFISTAIFLGSPHITVNYYIWKSVTPALLGNIVGGGLCVATLHWYLHLTGTNSPIPIDGRLYDKSVGSLLPEKV